MRKDQSITETSWRTYHCYSSTEEQAYWLVQEKEIACWVLKMKYTEREQRNMFHILKLKPIRERSRETDVALIEMWHDEYPEKSFSYLSSLEIFCRVYKISASSGWFRQKMELKLIPVWWLKKVIQVSAVEEEI